MQEWILHDFSAKNSKFSTANYFAKLYKNWNFLWHLKVLKNIYSLIPHLLKSDKYIKNDLLYVIRSNLFDIDSFLRH